MRLSNYFKIFITVIGMNAQAFAWEGMPMPPLHVEGRYLKDSSGHIVKLHGFAQTFSPWFNEQGTQWNNYDVQGCLNYNKSIIDKILAAGWKVNFVRHHMDPYWSNTPGCTPAYHEAHNCFNETRFRQYLDEVFVPMAEYAISKGLYVVMRPPGVSPEKISVGDDYHQYLIKVWGIVSRHPKLKNNPYIMFELANEPIQILGTDGTYGNGTQGHFDNLKTFFQTIVDTIRVNAGNILWIPGLGYQSLYAGFSNNPIEGENIGYAVHVYPGWFNSGSGYEAFKNAWDRQVGPVANFAPVVVTEMDWAPESYNMSWGKGVTGTAGGEGFGANFKKIMDDCGNVSWLLFTEPHLLAQSGDNNAPANVKAFLTDPEACPWPIYHWYLEYADEYDFSGATQDYLTMTDLFIEGDTLIHILNKSSLSLILNAVFADGHIENVSSAATATVDNPEVAAFARGRIFALNEGTTNIQISYTDKKGTSKGFTLRVTSSTFPLTNKLFNPSIWEKGTFDETTRTLKTGQWGFGGWQYEGIDLSDYKYLVARLGSTNTASVDFRIFDEPSYWSSPVSYSFGNTQEVVIPLKYAKKNNGKFLSSKNIYIIGFWSNGSNPFVIDTVFLTNSDEYDFPIVLAKDNKGNEINNLVGFYYQEDSGPSSSLSFFAFGDMLESDISVDVSDNYEISFSESDDFCSSLLINRQNGIVPETEIFVRLKEGLSKGLYNGSITLSSDGAQVKNISLSGTVEFISEIRDISVDDNEVVSVEYYSLTGRKLTVSQLKSGLVIEKKILSGGKVIINKKFFMSNN